MLFPTSSRVIAAFAESIQSLKVLSSPPGTRSTPFLFGTHDGNFHCDEALALSLLSLHPQYQNNQFEIVRTRNVDYLKACDFVVDVGAVYDPATHRYDHHQREFTGTFSADYKTKLSSAGIIYKHFGKEILANILTQHQQSLPSPLVSDSLETIVDTFYERIYKDFIEHIDGIDNGVTVAVSGELRYHVSTTLSSRVNRFNPPWNQPFTEATLNEGFKNAMLLTGQEFIEHVLDLYSAWWPARSIVHHALRDRFTIEGNEEGKILLLPIACPWKDHLFDLEDVSKGDNTIYVVYPDSGGSYRIQAVPVTPNSFESRKKLPEQWCGLRDDKLSEKAGVEGCIFIHATGFIGGHKTKEGALHLAREALKL